MATRRLFNSTLIYLWMFISGASLLFLLLRTASESKYTSMKFNTTDVTRWRNFLSGNNFWTLRNQKSAISWTDARQTATLLAASLRFDRDSDVPSVDCEKIFNGDEVEIERATEFNLEVMRSKRYESLRQKLFKSDQQELESARNCSDFKESRKYIPQAMSAEEEAYPIAYIITIHRDLSSFERLLRSIYHPQNVYCIHPDLKSDETFHAGVQAISGCFDNVFIASNITSIQYTHISRVEADLNCMKDLVAWYVINLCGQDFPLKTNLEIVRYLKSLGGYNNLETFHTPAHKKRRYELHFNAPAAGGYTVMDRTDIKKEPPPGGVEMFAGSAYYIFKRQAVEYFLKDPLVNKLIEWSSDTYSPDEFLWATIQRLYPQVPGSLPRHEKYDMNELVSVTRLVKWAGLDRSVYPKCGGVYRRGICVYGSGDLSWLIVHKHLFANKFDATTDMFAVRCMDEWIRNKTIKQSRIYNKLGYI